MKKRIANWVLLISGLTFLITYPYQDYSTGVALLMHMSGAAFIGGVADWYGVTALFHKPLGISFKTAIIPNSRDRFIELAGDMVHDELLTSLNIYKGIKEEKPLNRILKYLQSNEGKLWFKSILETVVLPLSKVLSWRDVYNYLSKQSIEENTDLSQYIHQIANYFQDKQRMKMLWVIIHALLLQLASSPEMLKQLEHILKETKDRYFVLMMNKSGIGTMLGLLAGMVSPEKIKSFINEEKISLKIQEEIIKYIKTQEAIDSTLGEYFHKKILELIVNLAENKQWQNNLLVKKDDFIAKGIKLLAEKDSLELFNYAQDYFYKHVNEIEQNESKKELLERQILRQIALILPNLREVATRITKEQLCKYTAEEMAENLEKQVAVDLQIIRVNGSLIGAVLGGLFYIIAILVQGVFL